MYRKDYTAHAGGFLTYVSLNLISNRIRELEDILNESIWIEVKLKSESFIIGNLYRPPHYNAVFWEKLNVCLEPASERNQSIIIVGDINENQLNHTYSKFKEILHLNNMINMINVITEPTRVTNRSQTLIDPIAVIRDILVNDSGIHKTPRNISDHFATFLIVNCKSDHSTPFKRKVWNYKTANFNELNMLIENHDWSFLNNVSVNEACNRFIKVYIELAQTCIPTRLVTIRPNDRPWYNSELRLLSRKRDRQKRKAIKSNNPSDWKLYRTYRNKVNNLKKFAREIFESRLELNLLELSSSNPKQYWKTIKMLIKDKKVFFR
jgi:hypothetical protein